MMSEKDWKNRLKDAEIFFHLGGIEEYLPVLQFQRKINSDVEEDGSQAHIILCEHTETYTCGIHTEHIDSRIPNPVRIERGGSITYHGPGQIVAYYIMNMKKLGTNVLGIINLAHGIETAYMKTHGIRVESRLHRETGIWHNGWKVGSTGFSIKGSTTMHGTALNINTDLQKFSAINPCGMSPEIMTSLSEISGKKYDMEKEKALFMEIISENMGVESFHQGKLSEQLSGIAP